MNKSKPGWLPQTRQFSQASENVVQRPEGIDANGSEGVQPKDVGRSTEKYSEIQASPGRWDEGFPLTSQPVSSAGGVVVLIEKDLGFTANAFLVDNWTNQWLYEPNLRRFIPPYTGAWIIPIPNGYQQARVLLRAPNAFTQPAAIAGEFVWVAWHEAYLSPASGIILGGSVAPTGAAEVVITDDAGNEIALVTNTNDAQGGGFALPASATPYLFNGVSSDRQRSASALNLANSVVSTVPGAVLTATMGEWAITVTPAANTLASVTKAAIGGVRHIARFITGDFVAGAVAPIAVVASLNLRDGASGAGTVLLSRYLALQAIAGDKDDTQEGPVNVVGTTGNAMTLEFPAAGGANTFEAVGLTGFDAA